MKIAQLKTTAFITGGTVALIASGSVVVLAAYIHATVGATPPTSLGASRPLPPGTMLTSAQVVQRCQEAYSAVQSYSGTTTVYNLSALPVLQAQSQAATVQYVRPGKIRVTGPDSNGTNYTIVSDGTTSYLQANGSWQKQASTEMAIGGATGISGMAATTIPALLLHTDWGYPFSRQSVLSPLRLADQDGYPCYRVTDTGLPNFSHTFWIDRKTYFLRRLLEDDSGSVEGHSFHVRYDMRFSIGAINQPMPASTFALPAGE